jgi:hypothetical protein
MSSESGGGMIYWQGKTKELGEKPVPVPLCPPQISHSILRLHCYCYHHHHHHHRRRRRRCCCCYYYYYYYLMNHEENFFLFATVIPQL